MINYKELMENYIDKNRDNIVSDLMELIKIPSVSTDRKECERVLDYVSKLYIKNGFKVEFNKENPYALAYYGEGEKSIGLFAHADVVDKGDKWVLTDAFNPIIKDGAIVGRGAQDDKSAVVLSLYLLKAIKELNIPINHKIICFTGANEENGMSDIPKYLKTNTPPDFSLVLDAAFPIYIGDKGSFWFKAKLNKSFEQIIDFSGGKSINIILGSAKATVKYSSKLCSQLALLDDITVSSDNDIITVSAKGISSHGSTPQGSKNAGLIIANALLKCTELCKNDREILNGIKLLLENNYGEQFNLENDDPQFGKLTVTNGIIEVKNQRAIIYFDLRYGKSIGSKEIKSKIIDTLSRINMDFELISNDEPYLTDINNPYVQALLKSYQKHTGDYDREPKINTGGTYGRRLPCAAELGTSYPYSFVLKDLPSGHGSCHQPDEHMGIDELIKGIKLVGVMLLDADKEVYGD